MSAGDEDRRGGGHLGFDEVIDQPGGAGETTPGHRLLGHSREGRPIHGFQFGDGPLHVSLIAGCHADEPVGPRLLDKLVCGLAESSEQAPESTEMRFVSWWIVPHVNPDGRAANAGWQEPEPPLDEGYDLPLYLDHVVREPPGEDVEFGFPRVPEDRDARPEAQAVAEFLLTGAPIHVHATLHGMAFAAGPWFLLESAWAERTSDFQESMRRRVRDLGYRLHDVDRGGEKGFRRLSEGFSTRPDSQAMAEHFRARGDEATAALFRPSSMEFARSLDGDALTLVSEMPLFLVEDAVNHQGERSDPSTNRPPLPVDAAGRDRFRDWLAELQQSGDAEIVRRRAEQAGIRPMPLRDQMRLQLHFILEAMRTRVSL